MMREEIEISRYEKVDKDFDSIIDLHKLISKGTNLEEHLIYFDDNFPLFFKKVINNKTFDFITVLKINKVLSGFIHFKLFENTIFLNNICLNISAQGNGMGKYFLKESLNLVIDETRENFELDVFLSNSKALNWYLNLGLEIQKKSTWVEILKEHQKNVDRKPSGIDFLDDNNGFKSIFYKKNKVGTFVNNKTILVHDLIILEKILNTEYCIVSNQDLKIVHKNDYKFTVLEISARMKGKLKDVINNLK